MASYNLDRNNVNLSKIITRLSSGYRVNSSIDAPGELAVAGRLNSKVIHSSVLKRNLMNVSTFLEVQNAHLLNLAEIYRERMALEIKSQDPLASPEEVSIYNKQSQILYDKILQIKEAKFNGARLFSPDHNLLTVDSDTSLINGAAETVSQFNLFTQNDPRPVEMIFLMDYSGSMGSPITTVRDNVENFVSAVQTRLKSSSWQAKAVAYRGAFPAKHQFFAPNSGSFVASTVDLKAQLSQIIGLTTGGGTPGETLIDGINDALNVGGGWQYSNSKKVLMAFTDEPSDPIRTPGLTLTDVTNRLQADSVNFWLFTNRPNGSAYDPLTPQLISQSGANTDTLSNANSNMSAAINSIVDSLTITNLADYDTITRYIAENGAKQQTISNLIDSAEMQGHNLRSAVGQIQDLDMAKESVNMALYDILQDAGTAILAQANLYVNATLTLLT